jgi:hypothetical protein
MDYLKKTVLPIFVIGIWINISESVRWIFLVESYWVEHYKNMNLIFPQEPLNMVIWMIWGFLLAITIVIISKKFTVLQTTFITWFVAFVMLWVVLWNINMLPLVILWYVVPLSLIEIYIGVLISKKTL